MIVNQQKKSNLLMYIILGLAFVMVAVWLYMNIESYTTTEDRGYQGEARINAFLAAEFFLRKMGQSTKKIKLFSEDQAQLKYNDTLFVPEIRVAFDRLRSKKIMQWVKQGGHLIVTGNARFKNEKNARDFILDEVGLYVERYVLSEDESLPDEPVDIAIEDEDYFWQANFYDYWLISKTENFNAYILWTIEDEGRTHGMQIEVGKGRLTLLSDIDVFRNDNIARYDHAAFLFSLTNDQLKYDKSGVFYYSLFEDQISIFHWLWKHAQPFMLSLMVLGIVILWMSVPRFGPLININQPIRRQFLNHLKASGNYYWRQGYYSYLLMSVRKQLSHAVKVKYPEWSNLNKQEQVKHFSEISQFEVAIIENALFDNEVNQVNDFINKIKILEELRKSI
ncbi:hypothetical protein MNBD_GAMMA08-962 [hydrothermal vent metagenome]|uniref:DUF4350 domain-containing protein n=1 Tax=hydrothermal vent metagenome TaxID=652676 RepID=A0A3B0Y4I8_9ZZZZ